MKQAIRIVKKPYFTAHIAYCKSCNRLVRMTGTVCRACVTKAVKAVKNERIVNETKR